MVVLATKLSTPSVFMYKITTNHGMQRLEKAFVISWVIQTIWVNQQLQSTCMNRLSLQPHTDQFYSSRTESNAEAALVFAENLFSKKNQIMVSLNFPPRNFWNVPTFPHRIGKRPINIWFSDQANKKLKRQNSCHKRKRVTKMYSDPFQA